MFGYVWLHLVGAGPTVSFHEKNTGGLSNFDGGQMPFIKKQPKAAPRIIELTITEMVRWNVHSILRNFVAEDIRVAQEIEEYLKKIGSKRVKKITADNSIIFEEDGSLREKPDYQRWGARRLSTRLKRKSESSYGKAIGGQESEKLHLNVEELVHFSLLLGVAPAYLLQPTLEQLEHNYLLRLKDVGDPDFEVRAVPWLLWVHGLRPLKQLDVSAFLFRMRELSTAAINIGSVNKPIPAMPKVDVSSPDGIDQDLKRWDQARKSPISALVDGVSIPEHGGPITSPPSSHPIDALKYGSTTENFDQNTKAYNLLMHHVRQAVVYMNDSNRQEDRITDIEWFLDRIREDLSAIAFFGDGSVSSKPEVSE